MTERLLISNARLVDPTTGRDERGSIALADGRIVASGTAAPKDFTPERTIDADGAVVSPGLVDLCARLGEPGHETEGLLESELAAAVAGGVTSLVCPPDTQPVLDQPGLVEMLKFRARNLDLARVYPLGALTRGLAGEALTEMAELTDRLYRLSQPTWSRDTSPARALLTRPLRYRLRGRTTCLGRLRQWTARLAWRGAVIAEISPWDDLRVVRRHRARSSEPARTPPAEWSPGNAEALRDRATQHPLCTSRVDMGSSTRERLGPPLCQQRDLDAIRAAGGTIDALYDHPGRATPSTALRGGEPGPRPALMLLGPRQWRGRAPP